MTEIVDEDPDIYGTLFTHLSPNMADFDPPQASQDPPPPEPQTQEDDIDASIEADIDMSGSSNPNVMTLDTSGDLDPISTAELNPVASAPDPRVPTKKDASLREFLNKMDDYSPIVRFSSSLLSP